MVARLNSVVYDCCVVDDSPKSIVDDCNDLHSTRNRGDSDKETAINSNA